MSLSVHIQQKRACDIIYGIKCVLHFTISQISFAVNLGEPHGGELSSSSSCWLKRAEKNGKMEITTNASLLIKTVS